MMRMHTSFRPVAIMVGAGLRCGVCAAMLACGAAAQTPTTQPQGGLVETFSGALGLGPDQVAPQETTQAAVHTPAPSPDPSAVTVGDTGRLDIVIRDAEIAALLEMISKQSRTNIVTSTSVTGTVSVNLYDVTLDEALDAILLPNQLAYHRVGNVIYVGTQEEKAANGPEPQLRVFPLHYIPRADALPLVKTLLSDVGTVAEPEEGGGAEEDAFTDAGPDCLVVIDTQDRLHQIETLLEQIDVRPQQVLIEATILRATLNESNQLGVDMTLLSGLDFRDVDGSSDAVTNLTLGEVPQGRLDRTTVHASSSVIGNMAGGGFTFGVIHNNVAAFVRALEEVTDVTVLAHPKVVTLNKQEAFVIVGRRDGYLTTTVTETAAIQTVEFLETGTTIELRPMINPDGTVRLDVRPKDSNGGLNASNLPFEETTEAHAQLIIDDGHTVLIGGLFRERTVRSDAQVPVLGEIPVADLLFQRKSDSTVREEVIILLTVRVLKNTPDEHAAMRELVADVERIRVGTRRGLMATGRERLAQAYYQEALKQAARGKRDQALLNVRMALYNQPNNIGAFKLREQLMDQRYWDNDGSRLRTFLGELLDDESSDTYGRPQRHSEILEGRAPSPSPKEQP